MIYNRDKIIFLITEGIDHSTHLKSLADSSQVALSNEIETEEKLINESHRCN